ncbi:MAG: YraN family protein [Myxococcota bacterium]|nr:YraN family protein [Myxococcota bacterium]
MIGKREASGAKTISPRRERGSVEAARRATLGLWGEEEVTTHLLRQGYITEVRRWSAPPLGEIDIVTLKGNMLCIVEVRTRQLLEDGTRPHIHPLETVTVQKQRRVARTAERYLSQRRGPPVEQVRFDIAVVWASHRAGPDGSSSLEEIEYFENAFSAPWVF